jgi:bifunctional ADP-heptose synthase (sugar kinase/adenylyltransferase)
MKILVIGETCKDIFHYGDCSRLCPDAPVPVFKLISTKENWGMARNVESNIHSLGSEVGLITNRSAATITKIRYMDNRTNHMFLRVDENDDEYGMLTEEEMEKVDFSQYDAVAVSDYNKGFLSEEILKKISLLHDIVLIDTKRVVGEWAEDFLFIKLNSKEHESTKHTLTEKLINKVIVTKGPQGAQHGESLYPVPAVEVKDTSGAGDTFMAALCFKYVESRDIGTAIRFANECATRVVQRRGVNII